MQKRDLPKGQLQPRAQPVSAFIPQGAITPAAPARPSQVQPPASFSLIQTGSRPNIAPPSPRDVGQAAAGNGEQLARSLGAFNQALLETTGNVLQWYATDQNERGFNEVMKAATMVDRQQQESALEYGEENRALATKDPLAAMAMDTVNPFRMGGRKRALAMLAGQEVPAAISLALSDPELAKLPSSSPRLVEARSAAVMEVLKRYGVQEGTPGFIDFVLPQLDRAWERSLANHKQTRVQILDETFAVTSSVALLHRAKDGFLNKGWGLDQTRNALQDYLDRELGQLGLPGKVAKYHQETVMRAWEIAMTEGDLQAASAIGSLLTGLPGDPDRIPVSLAYGLELGNINERIASREYTQLNRTREVQLREAKAAYLPLADQLGGEAAVEAIINGAVPGLDTSALSEADLVVGLSGLVTAETDLQEKLYDDTEFQEFLEINRDAAVQGQWDDQARDEFIEETERRIKAAPPGLRQQLRDERRRVLEGNDKARARGIGGAASRIISERIEANIAREYPEISLSNDAYNDRAWMTRRQDMAESRMRQRSALTAHVNAYLAQKQAAEGGRPLTEPEIIQYTNEAIDSYGSKDPKQLQYLFPGGAESGQPTSVDGGKVLAPAGGGGGGSTSSSAESAPTLYSGSTLQSAPNLDQWESTPLLEPDAVMDLVPRVLERGTFPRAFVNAAKRAGTSPGRLLLRQLEFMREPDGSPMFQLSPEQRRKVLTVGQRKAAADAYSETVASLAVVPDLGRGGPEGGPQSLEVVEFQGDPETAPKPEQQQIAHTAEAWAREWLMRLLVPGPVFDRGNPNDWRYRLRNPGGGMAEDGYYQIGALGNATGPHAHIEKLTPDGKASIPITRDELNEWIDVDGKPLNQGTAFTSAYGMRQHPTKGGMRMHHGADFAPYGPGKLTLSAKARAAGAEWVSHQMTSEGEESVFRIPGVGLYRILHGTFKKAPARTRVARRNLSNGPFSGANPTNMQAGMQALLRAGFPARGAAYLAGNIQQESSWNPGQYSLNGRKGEWKDPGGGDRAGGLVSWNDGNAANRRLSSIEARLGKRIGQASHAEQLAAMVAEMREFYQPAYRIFMDPNASDEELMRASQMYWGYQDVGERYNYARRLLGG